MINFYSYFNNSSLDYYSQYNRLIDEFKHVHIQESGTYPSRHFDKILHIIKSNPGTIFTYTTCVKKIRCTELEPTIIKDPVYAAAYADSVLKCRWPEAEPIIMKDPYSAYNYASDVIKGRWLEAEPYIMQDPYYAYCYAANVIGGRWPEAESIIQSCGTYWSWYKKWYNNTSIIDLNWNDT